HRLPDIVAAFEVGEAVMNLVVSQDPQADSMRAGNEGDAAEPDVKSWVAGERLMAGIMPERENCSDENSGGNRTRDVDPRSDGGQSQQDERQVQGKVGGEHRNRDGVVAGVIEIWNGRLAPLGLDPRSSVDNRRHSPNAPGAVSGRYSESAGR